MWTNYFIPSKAEISTRTPFAVERIICILVVACWAFALRPTTPWTIIPNRAGRTRSRSRPSNTIIPGLADPSWRNLAIPTAIHPWVTLNTLCLCSSSCVWHVGACPTSYRSSGPSFTIMPFRTWSKRCRVKSRAI